MKKILILGAGLSTHSLINFLLDNSIENDWFITVGDMSLETAQKAVNNHKNGIAIQFDIDDAVYTELLVKESALVVSMLPAKFHPKVAVFCVKHSVNLVTASYVSDEMQSFDKEANEKGIILLNESGLDPGIDHMSAMKIINKLKSENAQITAFKSYTGGLVAPKSDNNPWNYKFTWNPRNVVLAGQTTAKFIVNGQYKYVPYHRLFERIEKFEVLDYGEFEGYPNRDSLKYRSVYGLDNIPTMVRGTLRKTGYCKTWNLLVQLGMTDDTYTVENSETMTYREFTNSFLAYNNSKTVEEKLAEYLKIPIDSYEMYRLKWVGIFDEKRVIGLKNATPAQILQKLLEEKFRFEEDDRDLIVMQHIFEYTTKDNKHKTLKSSLVVEGKLNESAMSMTVGVPAAIAVKMILQGKITLKGVQIPTKSEIYEPILKELENYGVKFIEEETEN